MLVIAARLKQGASEERGSVIVLFALLAPALVLVIAFAVEIGNWYEHRRHLQVQTDAAVLAGAQLFSECFTGSSNANSDIESLASSYGGGSGSTYNQQVGGAVGHGSISLLFQSKTYSGGGGTTADDTDTQAPCSALALDVKATESGIPNFFSISPLATVYAHARVELRKLTEAKGLLPVAVPDVRFNYAFATFIDESSGNAIAGCPAGCTEQLQKSGVNAQGQQLWTAQAPLPVPTLPANIGVRLRLVAGPVASAPCGQLYTECYPDPSSSQQGVVYIHTWDGSAAAPTVHNAWLLPGSCSSDAYFSTGDCSAGLQAEVDLGASHPLTGATTHVFATVDNGSTQFQLSKGSGSSGLVTWTANTGLSITGSGPHTIQLGWDWQQNGCKGKGCTASGSFGTVQRAYEGAPDLTGPVQQVQVFEPGISSAGANSFQKGSTHTLGVSIATSGTLVLSKATDPPINLRVVGSQNGSIDCDPNVSNLRGEIGAGCGPDYRVNDTLSCPAYNQLWSTPQPWECVKTQTGGSVGQVSQGLQDRILGGSNSCTAPIHWPYDETQYPDDPRVIPLIVTPFGTFSGSGNDIVPVLDFGAFYVTGWNGDPCPGATSVAKGYVAGHFVKFIPRSSPGEGETKCLAPNIDPTQITPCVAVLTR
jgi:hypothetical protein